MSSLHLVDENHRVTDLNAIHDFMSFTPVQNDRVQVTFLDGDVDGPLGSVIWVQGRSVASVFSTPRLDAQGRFVDDARNTSDFENGTVGIRGRCEHAHLVLVVCSSSVTATTIGDLSLIVGGKIVAIVVVLGVVQFVDHGSDLDHWRQTRNAADVKFVSTGVSRSGPRRGAS